jgi:hypothetical protein
MFRRFVVLASIFDADFSQRRKADMTGSFDELLTIGYTFC